VEIMIVLAAVGILVLIGVDEALVYLCRAADTVSR
jgi:hypothetical protein